LDGNKKESALSGITSKADKNKGGESKSEVSSHKAHETWHSHKCRNTHRETEREEQTHTHTQNTHTHNTHRTHTHRTHNKQVL